MREVAFNRVLVPAVFLLAAMPLLVFLVFSVPPGEVPDEVAHILRADSIRHGEIAGFRRPRLDDQGDPTTDAAVRADLGLLAAGFAFSPGIPLDAKHETRQHLDRMRSLTWTNRLDPVSVPNTAVYPPLFYLPAAAGLQLAKHFGYGPYNAILGGRLMNVLAYLVLGATALFFADRGRMVLLAILCLPMSLWLAASINHDGIVIACSALAASLLCSVNQAERPKLVWTTGTIALALAALAKPFLLPMALIVLVTVPGGLRRNFRLAISRVVLAAAPAIAWAVTMALFVASPFVRGPARPAGPLWSGLPGTMFPTTNPTEQLRILFSSPSLLVTLPLRSAWDKGIWVWRETLGVLGTLDVTLPQSLYTAWAWGLGAAILAGLIAGRERGKLDGVDHWSRGAAIIGGVVSLWMTYLMQYLSWTRVGEPLVEGVQGRYFLPIAALALPFVAAPLLRIPAGRSIATALSFTVILLALSTIAAMSGLVLTAYYVR